MDKWISGGFANDPSIRKSNNPRLTRGESVKVKQLSREQGELVSALSKQLGAIRGVRAVVLGGSYARDRAQPGSDIDLGIFYSEAAPFSIQSVRELAEDVNDTAGPVVAGFYEWGPWVNGGAWLTIGGQRVDFLYRSLEHLERVIAQAKAGRYEVHYAAQFLCARQIGSRSCHPPNFPYTFLVMIADVRKLMSSQPFVAFTLHLADGGQVRVPTRH